METVVILTLLVAAAYSILVIRSYMVKREAFYEEVRDGSLQDASPENTQNRSL